MAYKYSIKDPHDIYFITSTIVEWVDLFTRKEYSDIIIDSLNFCQQQKGLLIHAWCIMPSHVHFIVSVQQDIPALSDIVRDFKKFTSKKIIEEILQINESRKGWLLDKFEFAGKYNSKIKDYKVWQDGYHPIACVTPKFLQQKLEYLHQNPVKEGYVWEAQNYKLSSATDYYESRKGLLPVVLIE